MTGGPVQQYTPLSRHREEEPRSDLGPVQPAPQPIPEAVTLATSGASNPTEASARGSDDVFVAWVAREGDAVRADALAAGS